MRKLAVVTLLALMLAACTRAEVSVVKYDCIRVVAEKEYQTRILGLFPYPSIPWTYLVTEDGKEVAASSLFGSSYWYQSRDGNVRIYCMTGYISKQS